MSKAFTREADDLPERPLMKQSMSALPPGVKNYITAQGLNNLRQELQGLHSEPISPLIRQRIYELEQSLQTAVVVAPPTAPGNQVLFGATVTVRNQQDEKTIYRIVGVDETDLDRGHISWLSPMAKALLKARVGEHVRVRVPAGEQALEIIEVRYESE